MRIEFELRMNAALRHKKTKRDTVGQLKLNANVNDTVPSSKFDVFTSKVLRWSSTWRGKWLWNIFVIVDHEFACQNSVLVFLVHPMTLNMTFLYRIFNTNNMTGASCWAGTGYPSVIPEFILVFSEVHFALSSEHNTKICWRC